VVRVFGYPFKSIIHEKFGDGIMSAISFFSRVDKVHEDGADWVVITLKGKSLGFATRTQLGLTGNLPWSAGKWLPYSKY